MCVGFFRTKFHFFKLGSRQEKSNFADVNRRIVLKKSSVENAVAVRWEVLTWEEIAAIRRNGVDTCLLPVGATEQHGPQLAVGMDSANAELLCHAVSARTGVPVLPVVRYGCSLGHSRRWPGTISLPPNTLTEIVVSIYDWIHGSGFRRLLIINGHVTNAAPLRCALEIIRSRFDDALVRLVNVAEISPRVRAEFFADAEDWHANAAETSLMLALAPELVRADKIKKSRRRGSHRKPRLHASGESHQQEWRHRFSQPRHQASGRNPVPDDGRGFDRARKSRHQRKTSVKPKLFYFR